MTGQSLRIPAGDTIALTELLAEYFSRTDRILDLPGVDVFADDGRIRLGKLVRSGRVEIAEYFADRRASEDATGRKTRHVMANVVVEEAVNDRAHMRFQCLVYAGVGEFPLPSAPAATIADFDVDCVRTARGWRIAELRGSVTFTGANAAPFTR